MKFKKFYISIFFCLLFTFIFLPKSFCAYPKLISTLNSAFEKIESWIIALSTPAAAIAVGTGVLMKKFSFILWIIVRYFYCNNSIFHELLRNNTLRLWMWE